MLLASKDRQTVRADFCGPDGSPVVSILTDPSGFLLYSPDDLSAVFVPGGIPAGDGLIGVNSFISLIRTGFPVVPEQWDMSHCCDTTGPQGIRWTFISSGESALEVMLEDGQLFPSLRTDGTELRITASSWHDTFNAWPLEWALTSPSMSIILRIRTISTEMDPPEEAWKLIVPVPIDTLLLTAVEWTYSNPAPVR